MKALSLPLPLPLPAHPFSTFPKSNPWRSRTFLHYSSRFRFSSSTKFSPSSDSNAEEAFTSQKFNSPFRDRENPAGPEYEDQEDFDPAFRFGSNRKKRRRWWSDEPSSEFEEEEPSGVFEQVIDTFWILKVFKSYGWTLPPIIISLLLNSGPKAFLMALALPLGQSILSLAFEKLWGTPERKPKRRRSRSKARKRPFYSTESRVQEEEEEEANENWEEKGKMGVGYQSWEVGSGNSEVKKEGRNGARFGGWEDLDGVGSQRKPFRMRGNKQSSTTEKGKLSWKEKKSDTPLLLRLLIAVFPFLGSWTRML